VVVGAKDFSPLPVKNVLFVGAKDFSPLQVIFIILNPVVKWS
jgi:hypothetical protein